MAVDLADRVAVATACLMVREWGDRYEDGKVFIPVEAATDESTILWIEDAELDGRRGWIVSVKDVSELNALDTTPLKPLEEEVAGDGEG